VKTPTGIWLYPNAPVHDLIDAVVLADEAGLDEVWIADEGVARDPFVVFAAAAVRTTRVRMGIGITSPALRHAGAIAATASSLDELAGGRVMLGFGVGGTESLGPFGVTVDKPVALVRDAIRVARSVLSGTESSLYSPPRHAAPSRALPIYVGARGEQLNRLASREADGVFLSGFTADGDADPIAWSQSVNPVKVALYASVRFTTDGSGDPTSLTGSADEIADALAALVVRYRPHSIGLALVDGDNVVDMTRSAIAVFERVRQADIR
jgi:alkanesulfonate monooxygenase SsuD/methylene tetrahydromethanopterin reductase-like flavin-dependent oxidoreductase (luciferase family)